MGTIYQFLCPSCRYCAGVSGGDDGGFEITTTTISRADYHGFRKKYLNVYLNEFVFRWNRRHSRRAAFERLMGIGLAIAPVTYADIRATAV